ncbi:MAG: hypothetical protein RR292_02420, partial [Christensenellaceae bacterium]
IRFERYGFQTEFFRMALLSSLALTTAKRRFAALPCKKILYLKTLRPETFGFLLRCKAVKRRIAGYFERHQRCSGQKDFVSGALVRVW